MANSSSVLSKRTSVLYESHFDYTFTVVVVFVVIQSIHIDKMQLPTNKTNEPKMLTSNIKIKSVRLNEFVLRYKTPVLDEFQMYQGFENSLFRLSCVFFWFTCYRSILSLSHSHSFSSKRFFFASCCADQKEIQRWCLMTNPSKMRCLCRLCLN